MDTSTLQGVFMTPPSSPLPTEETRKSPALAISDLNYYVQYRSAPWWRGACFRKAHVKHVLNHVNLALPAGSLTALVGSSGSGKTSLLDVIAFRAAGDVTGRIMYNGLRCTSEMMRHQCSYVIQADRLLPNLSVRETLMYTAYLKLPGDTTREQIQEKVEAVIAQMGLRVVADSRIGGAVVRGISGGEKRRVTIAIQLLQDPDILLLDEPTTGLDSFTARHLVASLQQLARQGKLVVVSIHQPRSDIARLIDHIVLLSQGQVVFNGPSTQLVPYFTELGYPCPRYTNPLDTYMDVMGIDRRDGERMLASSQRVQELIEAYQESELLKSTKKTVAREMSGPVGHVSPRNGATSPGWGRIFSTVLNRLTLNLYRDKMAFINRFILLPAFVPFILIFLGRLQNNQRSIQDRLGLLYQSVQVPPYVGILNALALFPALRNHFYREGLDGLYSSATFLLAYTIHIVPFVAVASVLFSAFLYWVTGMSADADKFAIHIAVVFVLHLVGELLTVAMMGVFRNPQLANTTTALIFTASGLVASGFLRASQNMVSILQLLSWVSVHKYSSEILVVNEFHQLNLTCNDAIQGVPCVPNGDVFLDANYPGAVDQVQRNIEILIAFLGGHILVAIVCFKVVGLRILQ
ncbi:LOW QUALITY PROTEIN: ATP-binding cassette sub-family G member 5-like [Pomacea canaliculata]|uniref:LOW QUALITY PROTEIN: ATP-binding cassette sub-family G member 5-like n=1 Tax=Pomacea canaliculata TaxID=400727 RepID=UPI000D72F461|nr:LOW QUALITY PROTEIN: ATP-binding cassette sub-family G member 5-like [Pomacea canaliculata]